MSSAKSSRHSGQQRQMPDVHRYWAGAVEQRLHDYWQNVAVDGRQRRILCAVVHHVPRSFVVLASIHEHPVCLSTAMCTLFWRRYFKLNRWRMAIFSHLGPRNTWTDLVKIWDVLLRLLSNPTLGGRRRSVAYECTVWVKKIPPPDIFSFFHKRLRIFNRFFTRLL